MEGLDAFFIGVLLANHCVLDDARREAFEFEFHLVAERTVQRWCLKAKGFEIERVAAACFGMTPKLPDQLGADTLTAPTWFDPELLQLTASSPSATHCATDGYARLLSGETRERRDFVKWSC